jgi:hypothetical protein
MSDDPRCCGSGTCIIDPEGRCWCGQQWDGQKMGPTPLAPPPRPEERSEPPARSPGSPS